METRLKIGLDVIPMHYPYSGVRAYVEALIAAYGNRDAGIDLTPVSAPSGLTRSSSRLTRMRWDVSGLAEAAKSADVELLHIPRFAAPRRCELPLVVTVHDLIPLQLPAYRATGPALVQSELARRYVPRASRIIVPSRYVAGVVESELGIDPSTIDVIPMGVDIPASVETPALISGPYLLHTGGFDVRKNLPILLGAFKQALPEIGSAWRLVLVGAPHSGNPTVYPPIWGEITRLGLQDRVVLTGRVNEREKHGFYQHARMAVNPSLAEGFGLPILEAMAHGVPVIASNCTSHPEVAGDAALLIEPTVDAIAQAIVQVAEDDALALELARKGRARAAHYPWSQTAVATAETYRRALDAAQVPSASQPL